MECTMSPERGAGSEEHEPAFELVSPDPSAMIESMRAYGYTLATAVADLIDNSVAAGASHVDVRMHWAGSDSWIRIADDGHGMDEDTLRNAMRLGSTSPLAERDSRDLGRFGLGLKTASLSQCRSLTVQSREAGRGDWVRRWDLDYLARPDTEGWRLLTSAQTGSEDRLALQWNTGTVVLWEKLDRIVGAAGKDDVRTQNHFLRLAEGLEEHLGMVFHRFLGGTGRRLAIRLNGREVAAWDPFLENHAATQRTPEEVLRIPDHPHAIRVRGFVLPHKDRLGDEGHRRASGPKGWNAQQGFYLYRNERLIVAGSWLGLGASRPWTQEEHYKLARLRLDVPNSMDHLWQLDVKKSSATPPPSVADGLKGLAQTVRKDARSVFAHRGRYGKRKSRQEVARPWKPRRIRGVRTYRIDRQHPVISALTAAVADVAREELEIALRIIEETVPIEQIWLDKSETPDDFASPFYEVANSELERVIQIAYRAIQRNRGLDHDETVEQLLSLEEFSGPDAQAIIGMLEGDE
jgi:hypothetical protein